MSGGAWLMVWALFAGLSAIAGSYKGRFGWGLALGVLFGLFGLIATLFLPPTHKVKVDREVKRQRVIAEAAQRNRTTT